MKPAATAVRKGGRVAHAIVPVRDGDVTKALRGLKRHLEFTGTSRTIRRRADGYVGHAERRRLKSRAARSRTLKVLKRRERVADV